jgi:biopolymer transport protein ExbD
MLAGVIAKQKEMYDVDLASAVIDDYIEKDKHILFIKSNGEIIFNNEAITIKTLDEKLKLIDDKNIIVAADKLVTTGKLNNILIKLNKNKISSVTLLSNENE